MSPPENKKYSPLYIFLNEPTLKNGHFWAEEALDDQMRGCLNVTSAQTSHVIFQIFAKKSFPTWQKSFCTFLYNFGLQFAKITWQNL